MAGGGGGGGFGGYAPRGYYGPPGGGMFRGRGRGRPGRGGGRGRGRGGYKRKVFNKMENQVYIICRPNHTTCRQNFLRNVYNPNPLFLLKLKNIDVVIPYFNSTVKHSSLPIQITLLICSWNKLVLINDGK